MRPLAFLSVLLLALLCPACTKVDEIAFSGTVIDTRECTADMLRPNLGYVVQLSSPDSVGADYILDGVTYHNAVILYEPQRIIYENDKLSGSFYFDDDYSKVNCSIHWNDFELPSGVFVDLTVE